MRHFIKSYIVALTICTLLMILIGIISVIGYFISN